MPTRLIDNIWYDSPQPLLTAGESVKQVPYHPDLTTGYAGIAPRTTATSSVRKREQP
ncbi:hypothetical protein RPT58_002046 [Escherichia coli]|nr:hypothetical protein [Escherichia coli]ESA68062.1 hypothetical protein HMPREF1588_04020 [Escherichia coli 110957]ELI4152220.1 hypothetical protein [Escherichia coli]MCV4711000.1 hypothetical protein [Escherichia coli]MCV4894115.1 hypothetical protein [Escherichia coli]